MIHRERESIRMSIQQLHSIPPVARALVMALAVGGPPCLCAEEREPAAQRDTPPPWRLKWLGDEPGARARLARWSISGAATRGIRTEYSGLGSFPALTAPGAAIAGIDHFYDDGYNRVDISGNAGNLTLFWGYDNASQNVAGSILMNSSSLGAPGRLASDNELAPGIELRYDLPLARVGGSLWGLAARVGWAKVENTDRRTTTGAVTVLTHAYSLGGAPAPAPGHAGLFGTPGPLLSDIPVASSATVPGGATIAGLRSVAADLATLRLGPWMEFALTDRLFVQLAGGGTAMLGASRFEFTETTTIPAAGVQTASGTTTKLLGLGGGFLEGGIRCGVSEHAFVFASAAQQWLTGYQQSVGGRQVNVRLDSVTSFSVGIGLVW